MNPLLLLSIDDDQAMRVIVTDIAQLAGYQTIDAGTPRTIVSSLDENPDVIVLDISMPDMDGIEVIFELVKRKWRGELIVLSGFNKEVLSAATSIATMSGIKLRACLTKPFNVADLKNTLEAIATEATCQTG
jgi:CheY-like chemotaxis protein